MDTARTAGTKGVPRPERERQILDIAAEEFGRHGYGATSLATIANRAGISKPLVISYFGSKEGLYIACVDRAGANLASRIEDVLAGGYRTRQMADETLQAIFRALEPRRQDWNVIFDRTLPAGGAAEDAARRVRSTVSEQAARGVAFVGSTQNVDDPLDLSVLTDVWISAVTAVVNWWVRHPDQTTEQMIERCRRVVTVLTGEPVLAAPAVPTRHPTRQSPTQGLPQNR